MSEDVVRLLHRQMYREALLVIDSQPGSVHLEVYRAVAESALTGENKLAGVLEGRRDALEVYAEYLIGAGRAEESVSVYKQTLLLSSTPEERTSTLRAVVFLMVYLKKEEEMFLFAKDLLETSSSKFDFTLLFWVCHLVTPAHPIYKEAEKVRSRIGKTLSIPAGKTEAFRVNQIEVVAAAGVKEFISRLGVGAEENKESSKGLGGSEVDLCRYSREIELGLFKEIFRAYARKANKETEAEGVAAMCSLEDTHLLMQVGNAMYRRSMFSCSRYVYKGVLEVLYKIDRMRYKFIKLAFTLGSPVFFQIANSKLSPVVKEALKKYNVSVYLTDKGKSTPNPEVEQILSKAIQLCPM